MNLSNKDLSELPPLLEKVTGNFDCSDNKLVTLNGSPKEIYGYFNCSHNKLTNLYGSAKYVGGAFQSEFNKLTSLYGVSKIIKGGFYIRKNPNLLDISDIWDSEIGGIIYFDLNSGMAILPLIKFKVECYISIFTEIHERNQGSSKQNILDFQYDLMKHGYEDNARWKPITG